MSNPFSLEGKIAFVTGASYGIGFAIASGMAKAGAKIVFNDIKQELVDKGLAAYKEAGIKKETQDQKKNIGYSGSADERGENDRCRQKRPHE